MRFYLDEHISRAVEKGLIDRGHEVIVATDAGMRGADDDSEHLVYATENNAIVVTCDYPFAGRTMSRSDHAGLICWTGVLNDFGGMIRRLDRFSQNHTQEEVRGQVFWLK